VASEIIHKLCDYCDLPLIMLPRWNHKKQKETIVPCEEKEYVRDGSDPLPKGIYFDVHGKSCNEENAPCKVVLLRSHWSECPGADKARRKR
jgi:hypothetical protein